LIVDGVRPTAIQFSHLCPEAELATTRALRGAKYNRADAFENISLRTLL
jgi:hypothetical protein